MRSIHGYISKATLSLFFNTDELVAFQLNIKDADIFLDKRLTFKNNGGSIATNVIKIVIE